MAPEPQRPAFAGGDQAYLREVQYRNGSKLDARSHLHQTYATSPVSFATFEARLIDWPLRAQVLDCGCGTGRFWSADGLRTDMTITLTDLSAGMVDEATNLVRRLGFDASGREADVQTLPFVEGSFDVVVANHMLYHVPDPDVAVAELARVVRADGVVLAATNGYGHMREINEAIADVFGDHGEQLYEVFGIDSGERRLRAAFRSVVWHAFDNDLIVDDPAAVVDYGLSFPPGEFASPRERASFRRRIESAFADGPLRIRTRAGVFVCRNPR